MFKSGGADTAGPESEDWMGRGGGTLSDAAGRGAELPLGHDASAGRTSPADPGNDTVPCSVCAAVVEAELQEWKLLASL